MLLIGDRLRSQGIAAEVAVDAPGATVHAGRVRLEQVLINLLQNAAEAMQGRPDARIILRIHGDTPLHIDVCDNGPGVPEALKPQLFTPFAPGRAAGPGRGPAIARQHTAAFGARPPPPPARRATR